MAETMATRVLEAVIMGARTLSHVVDMTKIPRPKAYATLHQLKLDGKLVRTGPRGWERGRWSLATTAASTEEPNTQLAG